MPPLVKAERPEKVDGSTIGTMTGCGRLYVTLGQVDGKPFETFATMGKAGGCAASQIEAIGRLISLVLRYGITPEQVVKQLKGISCHSGGEGCAKSCADAIACVIESETEEAQPELPEIADPEVKLCVSDGMGYQTDPTQFKCRNCGTFWIAGADAPICKKTEEADEPDRD